MPAAAALTDTHLRRAMQELEASGIAFDEQQLGDDVFNQATFTDPTGHCVRLLEARTFSPPHIEIPDGTTCGYFLEYGIPARDTVSVRTFWESLGFVGMDEHSEPFPRLEMTSDHLDLALYRSRAFRQPVLTFEAEDMR